MNTTMHDLEFGPGERVARILGGEPPFERGSRYEPSLLPHLARLCHDFSIDDVLQAADLFGRGAGHPHGWPQIWESTFTTLLDRFGADELGRVSTIEALDLEIETYRALAGGDVDIERLRDRVATDGRWHAGRLLGRLISVDAEPAAIESLISSVDPHDLDAEAVRRVLVASRAVGFDVPTEWFDAAVGLREHWIDRGRAAHLMTALPNGDRRRIVDRIVDALDWDPPWYLVLLASRLTADLDEPARVRLRELVDGPVWRSFADELIAAGAAHDLDADLLRAHPFASDLVAIEGPHESTQPAAMEMIHDWGGAPPPAAASAPDVDIPSTTPAPPIPPPPPIVVGEPAGEPATATPNSGLGRTRSAGGFFDRVRERFTRRRTAEPDEELGEEGEEETTDDTVDDRRLGVDAWLGGHQLTRGLVAGAEVDIEVSIGPPGSAQIQTGAPVDIDWSSVERRVLPVRFITDDDERWDELAVRQDPMSRAAVTFSMTPAGERFTALIVVYEEDRATVVEAASFAAEIATDLAAADVAGPQRLVKVPAAGIAPPSDDTVGSVVADADRVATSAGTPVVRLPQNTDGALQPVLASMRTKAANFATTHDRDQTRDALVTAATFGHQLRRQVGLDALAHVDRIHVVSLSGDDVFPLELVYGGDPPLPDARVCEAWWHPAGEVRPTDTGRCPACTDLTDRTVVCPLRFWGLTKRIEHYGAPIGTEHAHATTRRFDPDQIVATPTTVVGASDQVVDVLARVAGTTAAEADVADLLAELVTRLPTGAGSIADGWGDWCAQVGQRHPGLLIAMPHQESDRTPLPSLELGGEFESTLLEQHVRAPGEKVGPVVLLLGCDTSAAPNRIASFASEARFYAPVVVATLGKVIAQEAPHVAGVLVDHLSAARTSGTSIGDAVIEARRALLAESRLVGLQLVAHGDARWKAGG